MGQLPVQHRPQTLWADDQVPQPEIPMHQHRLARRRLAGGQFGHRQLEHLARPAEGVQLLAKRRHRIRSREARRRGQAVQPGCELR